jgi:hypothetical protein
MVAKDKKTITATKVGTNLWEGTAIQLADQEVYDGFNKENFFVSPKNVSGIERLAKKYATKFPDFVATILAMNAPATPATSIPAAITNASEEVKTIKRKRKSRAKAIGKLKKDGTPDRRYLNQPATA